MRSSGVLDELGTVDVIMDVIMDVIVFEVVTTLEVVVDDEIDGDDKVGVKVVDVVGGPV